MKRFKMVVQSNPVAGKEDEFVEWYIGPHFDKLLSTPGVVSAEFYRMADTQRPDIPPGPWKYMAIYEIEANDVQEMVNTLTARRHLWEKSMDEMIGDRIAVYYEPLTPVIPAKDRTKK